MATAAAGPGLPTLTRGCGAVLLASGCAMLGLSQM